MLALTLILSQASVPALAQTYSITLQTNAPSYSGSEPIQIAGQISPAPGPNTGVLITIDDSAGSAADIAEVVPNAATGSFNYTSYPGGNSAWTTGSFTVNATWGGDGETASQVTTFSYTAGATSSTSSSSSASSSASSTGTSSTSSASSSQATPAPEFPSSALALVALIGVALVAALSRSTSADLRPGSGLHAARAVRAAQRRIK